MNKYGNGSSSSWNLIAFYRQMPSGQSHLRALIRRTRHKYYMS